MYLVDTGQISKDFLHGTLFKLQLIQDSILFSFVLDRFHCISHIFHFM